VFVIGLHMVGKMSMGLDLEVLEKSLSNRRTGEIIITLFFLFLFFFFSSF
jgi:hypothetical protein